MTASKRDTSKPRAGKTTRNIDKVRAAQPIRFICPNSGKHTLKAAWKEHFGPNQTFEHPSLEMIFEDGMWTGDPQNAEDVALAAAMREAMEREKDDPTSGTRMAGIKELKEGRVKPPFQTFDDVTLQELMTLVTTGGFDPTHCITYEEQNQNRPQVIEALDDLLSQPVEEDPLSVPEL